MNHRFLIVLSVAIFYNGVIYASPFDNPDIPPERTTTPMAAKAHDIAGDHPVLNTKKLSASLNQSEIPANIQPNATSINATVAPQVIESKNVTHDTINQNSTSVIDQNNSTLITDGKNASLPISNATSPNKNDTGLPSTVLPSTVAPQNITSTPAVPDKSTTTTTTTAAPTTLSTTTTTKMNDTNSTSTDKAVVHDVATSVQEQHFHGPSFIGGIVLTVGLTAIGFIAFKYYKAGKIDMNYRTL